MINKLLITNNVPSDTFSLHASKKIPINFFKENGWETIFFDDDWNKNLEKYDIIVVWSIQQHDIQRNLKTNCIKKLIELQNDPKYKYKILDYLEDVHHLKNFYKLEYSFYTTNFSKESKNYIILRYETCLNKYFSKCNCYLLPYSIESSVIPSFNETPINKILLTGYIDNNAYPIRQLVFNLRNKYKIDVLNHPGYRKIQHNFVGEEYFKKLNKYLISVATCGFPKYNYSVGKYFEIPASGALLLAFTDPIIKELEKYGFKDMENMVSFNKKNLEEKIKYVLNPENIDEINKIRLNGYNLILNKHTHNQRFDVEFNDFIGNL